MPLILIGLSVKFFGFDKLDYGVGTEGVKVSITSGKIEINNNDKRYFQFILPAHECWFDTGIILDSNEKCEVRISGSIHLAVDMLAESASKDIKPVLGWTGPAGIKLNLSRVEDLTRAKLLLKEGDIIGDVIGFLYTGENVDDFCQFYSENRDELTKKSFRIKDHYTLNNVDSGKGKLYISINDVLLDFKNKYQFSELVYRGKGKNKFKSQWESVYKNDYKKLWFDDNIGSLLVAVEVTKKEK